MAERTLDAMSAGHGRLRWANGERTDGSRDGRALPHDRKTQTR